MTLKTGGENGVGMERGEVILSNIAEGLDKLKAKMSPELGNEKGTGVLAECSFNSGQDRGQMPLLILTVNRNSMTHYAPPSTLSKKQNLSLVIWFFPINPLKVHIISINSH